MDKLEIKCIVEALLFSSEEALSLEQILAVFEDWHKPSQQLLQEVLSLLAEEYSQSAIELKEVSSGFRFQTRPRYSLWVSRMLSEKPAKYSKAALETLAIIAYRQPVTRGDIEEIRGVSVNTQVMKMLQEREWIKVAGYRDVPGRPALYVTTKAFLNYFNLKALSDLPLVMGNELEQTTPIEESENE